MLDNTEELQADTESNLTKGSLHSEAWPQMNRSNIEIKSKFHSKIAQYIDDNSLEMIQKEMYFRPLQVSDL